MLKVDLHPRTHSVLELVGARDEHTTPNEHFFRTQIANFGDRQAEIDSVLHWLLEGLAEHHIHKIIWSRNLLAARSVDREIHQQLRMLSRHKVVMVITALDKLLKECKALLVLIGLSEKKLTSKMKNRAESPSL